MESGDVNDVDSKRCDILWIVVMILLLLCYLCFSLLVTEDNPPASE